MKRIIAIFLIVIIVLSMSGCQGNFDIDEEALGDWIKQEISEAVDNRLDKVEDEVSNKNEVESCECSSYTLKRTNKNNIFKWDFKDNPFKKTDDTYVLQCKACSSPYPVKELKFSVFLKYFYPKKDQEKLSQEKKKDAIDPYIRTKMLMTGNEMICLNPDICLLDEASTPFEQIGAVAGRCSELLKIITGQNSKELFLLYNGISTAAKDVGGINDFNIIDNANLVLSVIEYVSATLDVSAKAKKYEKTKEMGVEYIFFAKEDYVDLALASANAIAKLANVIGCINPFSSSVGALTPDVNKLLKDVEELAEDYTLRENYLTLTSPISGFVYINDMLPKDEQFSEINKYDKTTIKNAMKAGPCAKEIERVILDVIRQTENIGNSKEKVPSALWYYYGWRLEYEYEMFLEWIYADEYCDFQSFLKNPPSENTESGQ